MVDECCFLLQGMPGIEEIGGKSNRPATERSRQEDLDVDEPASVRGVLCELLSPCAIFLCRCSSGTEAWGSERGGLVNV